MMEMKERFATLRNLSKYIYTYFLKLSLRKLGTINIFIGDTAYMQHYETTRCMSECYFEQFLMSKDFFLPFSCKRRTNPYLCIVFFIVLDLRLTRLGYSGIPFFMPSCE